MDSWGSLTKGPALSVVSSSSGVASTGASVSKVSRSPCRTESAAPERSFLIVQMSITTVHSRRTVKEVLAYSHDPTGAEDPASRDVSGEDESWGMSEPEWDEDIYPEVRNRRSRCRGWYSHWWGCCKEQQGSGDSCRHDKADTSLACGLRLRWSHAHALSSRILLPLISES